ncbi:hypothetical protein GIB67_040133 [Kingdonia uniflora]|uniref:BHLH domain-containing protein n=1 Tax=Kingdonia uniflora TaxID=39325 RepID=A0A7J7MUL8_9MAGN|nr:hypothetical protein GIB67_040133 [Kingdonia uniflora]
MDGNLLRQQQHQLSSGLMRLRSAPSSLMANFIDEVDGETDGFVDFLPPTSHTHRSSSPEADAESIFARFMSSCGNGDLGSPNLSCRGVVIDKSPTNTTTNNGFSPTSQMMFQTLPPTPPPPSPLQMVQNHNSNAARARERDFRGLNSMDIDNHHQQQQQVSPQVKLSSGIGGANLIRHSSSPAGLFANLAVENGFAVMRNNNMGNFHGGNGNTSTNGDVAVTTSRLKNQMSYSSGPPSSSQIGEMGGENGDDVNLGNSNVGNRYIPNFPINSWEDAAPDNFQDHKRVRDISGKMISSLNSSETQNAEIGNRSHGLTHHFSLPKTSDEMAAILQFQDSVPCKIRAKRGCATHPRSIAERVRRTKISERMRKLQELVPNMDKQTNTADMLDLAVEYIKDLQKEVKENKRRQRRVSDRQDVHHHHLILKLQFPATSAISTAALKLYHRKEDYNQIKLVAAFPSKLQDMAANYSCTKNS